MDFDGSFIFSLAGLHSELTTQRQVTPKIKMENKTVVATAGNVLLSLRSARLSPAVLHL
jgi:hypothetical protein